MNIKNIVSVAVLLGVASFTTTLSCKPTHGDLFSDTTSTTTTGVGGAGGTSASTTASVTTTSTASGEDAIVEACDPKCPRTLPKEGEACDGSLDQYCEYAQGACRTARCSVGKNVWEIRFMDPCVCYKASSSQE